MASEQDRAAMLERIRMDMAQTRERLKLMKERKESNSSLSSTSPTPISTTTTTATTTTTNKASSLTPEGKVDAISIVEKLKRERELKSKSLMEVSSSVQKGETLPIDLSSIKGNSNSLPSISTPKNNNDDNNNTNNENIITNDITLTNNKEVEVQTTINNDKMNEAKENDDKSETKLVTLTSKDIQKKENEENEIKEETPIIPKLTISGSIDSNDDNSEMRTRQSSPSVDYTGENKKVVIVRKNADGTEVREVVQAIGEDGDRMITADGKVIRVRKVTLSQGDGSSTPKSANSLTNKPSPGDKSKLIGNSRLRKPSIDHGSTAVSNLPTPKSATNAIKSSSPMGGAGKGIRSLEDLQKAIKKADNVKKQAQAQGKIEQLRRERDQSKLKLSREEKKALRASKRLTVEMQHSETRIKVNDQISSFMKMMQTLEVEWQKGEEMRLKREQELEQQRKMLETAGEQMGFLAKTMGEVTMKIDHMKLLLDRMIDNAPKGVKKEERWFEELKSFQELYWQMRHNLYVSTAKYNKLEKKTTEAANAMVDNGQGVPPPPPMGVGVPPPPPSSPVSSVPLSTPNANPISNLLAQIRSGTSLKKLDPDEVKKEQANRKGQWRQSVALLQGLQDTLRDALDQRHLALLDSDDEDDDDEDDDYWDDDDE